MQGPKNDSAVKVDELKLKEILKKKNMPLTSVKQNSVNIQKIIESLNTTIILTNRAVITLQE